MIPPSPINEPSRDTIGAESLAEYANSRPECATALPRTPVEKLVVVRVVPNTPPPPLLPRLPLSYRQLRVLHILARQKRRPRPIHGG